LILLQIYFNLYNFLNSYLLFSLPTVFFSLKLLLLLWNLHSFSKVFSGQG
jgi:hypothetical protein